MPNAIDFGFVEFPTELLICETAFLVGRNRRTRFPVRMAAAVVAFYALAAVWATVVGAVADRTGSLVPFVFLYLGYAALSAIPVFAGFDLTMLEGVFVIAGGYATEHMIYALVRIVLYLSFGTVATAGVREFVFSYAVYALGAFLVHRFVVRGDRGGDGFRNGDLRIAVLAMILAVAAIALSVSYSYPEQQENMYTCVICPAYGFICCALILVLDYHVLRENGLKLRQEMLDQLLSMANAQQRGAREAIDIINVKCHDLKHQIRALAAIDDGDDRRRYVREVQRAVSIYDSTYHTGCEALDYVLTEKSLLAKEHRVAFGCIADGAQLRFMDSTDIYALMGNALDNALESVMREPPEERTIDLRIKRRGDMVLIDLTNRCSRDVEFRDGLPVTDKPDRRYHGFGMRSMRGIAEKYGGELTARHVDGRFRLDILLPAR